MKKVMLQAIANSVSGHSNPLCACYLNKLKEKLTFTWIWSVSKRSRYCREQQPLLVHRQWEDLWKKLMKFTERQWSTDRLLPCCWSLWDQNSERQRSERFLWWRSNTMLHDWYAPLTGRQHTITLTCSVQPTILQGSHLQVKYFFDLRKWHSLEYGFTGSLIVHE